MKKACLLLLLCCFAVSLFAKLGGVAELRKLFDVYKKGAVASIAVLKKTQNRKSLLQADKQYRASYNKFMRGLVKLVKKYPALLNGDKVKHSNEYKQISIELVMLGKQYKKERLTAAKRLYAPAK